MDQHDQTFCKAVFSLYNMWREEVMTKDNQTGEIPSFQLRINDSAVSVRFSNSAEQDVRTRVRDILTEAYEERFQQEISVYAHLV